jgi:hypothetical protein
MAQVTLFINTTNGTLAASQTNASVVDPSSLPLYYGDTLLLNIYLLQTPPGYDPANPTASQLQTVPLAGLTLYVYMDDGTVNNVIYTQQIAWSVDPTVSFFYASLPLNTAPLLALFANAATSATVWLKIGYVQNGLTTTVFSEQVTMGVGLPNAPLVVPPGLTPLSVEVAKTMFLQLAGVAGGGFYLISAAGKKVYIANVDQGDGTAAVEASPVN